jgi:hypothetical protein
LRLSCDLFTIPTIRDDIDSLPKNVEFVKEDENAPDLAERRAIIDKMLDALRG